MVDATARYRALLGRSEVPSLITASVVSRFPLWILTLSIVIFIVERTGDYGRAGLVVAAYNVAMAVAAPLLGRLADRHGHPRLLVATALLYTALMGLFVWLAGAHADNLAALLVSAVLAGAMSPPLNSCIRVMWGRVTDSDTLTAAYSLEGVLVEVMAVGSRLAVGVLLLVLSSGSLTFVSALVAALGTLWLATLRAARVPAAGPENPPTPLWSLGALRSAGTRTLIVANTCIGFAFGTVVLAPLTFVDAEGSPEVTALGLACFSAGGVIAGIVYGARPPAPDPVRRFAALGGVMAVGVAAVALAWDPWALLPLLLLPGLAVPPLMTTVQILVDIAAGGRHLTESRAWLSTSLSAGVALGSAATGALATWLDWRVALVVAAVVTAAGAALVLARRAGLRAPEPAPSTETVVSG